MHAHRFELSMSKQPSSPAQPTPPVRQFASSPTSPVAADKSASLIKLPDQRSSIHACQVHATLSNNRVGHDNHAAPALSRLTRIAHFARHPILDSRFDPHSTSKTHCEKSLHIKSAIYMCNVHPRSSQVASIYPDQGGSGWRLIL